MISILENAEQELSQGGLSRRKSFQGGRCPEAALANSRPWWRGDEPGELGRGRFRGQAEHSCRARRSR